MRIYEKLSGRVVPLSWLVDNHFHILLEVPPTKHRGLSDGELLGRLREVRFKSVIVQDDTAAP